MATIEQLLGASAMDIAAMNDSVLAEYLKDITELEPKPKLVPLVKSLDLNKDDEPENPIKLHKKSKSKQVPKNAVNSSELDELEKELQDLK